MRFLRYYLWFISAACLNVNAQQVQNVRVFMGANTVEGIRHYIVFDLRSRHNNIPCKISVRYKTSSREIYLKNVYGDVGDKVYPGSNKQITWDYAEDLIHSVNEGDAEIKIEVTPNVKVNSIIKKGKQIEIKIDSIYATTDNLSFRLYRKNKEQIYLVNGSVKDSTIVARLPKRIKTGKDYQLAIGDGANTYFSNAFKLRARVPMFYKVLPMAALAFYFSVINYGDGFFSKKLEGIGL